MKAIRVYRLEHGHKTYADGVRVGPFWGDEKLPPEIYDAMRQPAGPREWFSFDYDMYFACPTRAALLRWFRPEIQEALERVGYVIAIYEVPDYHVERDDIGWQCAFRIKAAQKVEEHVWSEYRQVLRNERKHKRAA